MKLKPLFVSFLIFLIVFLLIESVFAITLQITLGVNDGYINQGNTAFDSTGGYVYFTGTTTTFSNWFRYAAVTIPKNALILTAVLQIYASNNMDSGGTTKIRAFAEDNATAPTSTVDYNGRTKTGNYSDYTLQAWTATTWYNTSDISSVVQEIVNRAGWISGNNVTISLDNTVTGTTHYSYCTYESNPAITTKLIVTWSTNTYITKTGIFTLAVSVSTKRTESLTRTGKDTVSIAQVYKRAISTSRFGKAIVNIAEYYKKTVAFPLSGSITEAFKMLGMFSNSTKPLVVYMFLYGKLAFDVYCELFGWMPFVYTTSGFNLDLNVEYYLFGGGRYIGLILIVIALFLINWLHKYSFIITVTLAFLMAILYFKRTPPLVWEAIITTFVGVILMLTGALKLKH